ncbi:TPA: hypothetical protein DEG21_01865 [Patescibacteria group bacterium]|nr:hypothetical protein [Candidatus Gracilibacteria bacterium]HBY74634.1 hypothetical protein [Candidatus Gracilibacteria bacterium]
MSSLFTDTLYSVAHSQYFSGTNSTTFHPVHLHFPAIFGVISTGQGKLSLLSKEVRGISGILNKTSKF